MLVYICQIITQKTLKLQKHSTCNEITTTYRIPVTSEFGFVAGGCGKFLGRLAIMTTVVVIDCQSQICKFLEISHLEELDVTSKTL